MLLCSKKRVIELWTRGFINDDFRESYIYIPFYCQYQAMIPEEQCGTERKEILSSIYNNKKFMPSHLIKTAEKKIIDRTNNSKEKVSKNEFSAVKNDIEPYKKLELNIKQNLSLPSRNENTKIYGDHNGEKTKHDPSSDLKKDHMKASASQSQNILPLQESASKEHNFEKQIPTYNTSSNYKFQDTSDVHKMKTMAPQNSIEVLNVGIVLNSVS